MRNYRNAYALNFKPIEETTMKTDNIIVNKSKSFALRIINLQKFLCNEKKEYTLSNQLLKSGTSIGANVKEAIRAQSKPDFYSKMNIALKEASETEYWLELLFETDCMPEETYQSLRNECGAIRRMLIASLTTIKAKAGK